MAYCIALKIFSSTFDHHALTDGTEVPVFIRQSETIEVNTRLQRIPGIATAIPKNGFDDAIGSGHFLIKMLHLSTHNVENLDVDIKRTILTCVGHGDASLF